jgi:hypothetical protein
MGCAPAKQLPRKEMGLYTVGETVHCMLDAQNHVPTGLKDHDEYFVGTILQKTPEMEADSAAGGMSTNVRTNTFCLVGLLTTRAVAAVFLRAISW